MLGGCRVAVAVSWFGLVWAHEGATWRELLALVTLTTLHGLDGSAAEYTDVHAVCLERSPTPANLPLSQAVKFLLLVSFISYLQLQKNLLTWLLQTMVSAHSDPSPLQGARGAGLCKFGSSALLGTS
jgi:hypothetical protein